MSNPRADSRLSRLEVAVGPLFYITQERAFATGIARGWPKVIPAPHSQHGRLVRRNGDPERLIGDLVKALKAVEELSRSYTRHYVEIPSNERAHAMEMVDAAITAAKATHDQ